MPHFPAPAGLLASPWRLLGIDAGFSAPGYAVLELTPDTAKVLTAGCIQTKAISKKQRRTDSVYKSEDDARRIEEIAVSLAQVIREWSPDVAAVELPSAGAKSAAAIRGMAYATSVTASVLALTKIPVYYLTPRASKVSTTGDGAAEKMKMVEYVSREFPRWIRS
jgi:Holliday junction resolvasome RuvABC endonuclease subunit